MSRGVGGPNYDPWWAFRVKCVARGLRDPAVPMNRVPEVRLDSGLAAIVNRRGAFLSSGNVHSMLERRLANLVTIIQAKPHEHIRHGRADHALYHLVCGGFAEGEERVWPIGAEGARSLMRELNSLRLDTDSDRLYDPLTDFVALAMRQ